MSSPATHFGAVAIKSGTDEQVERANAFMEKIVNKAQELFD